VPSQPPTVRGALLAIAELLASDHPEVADRAASAHDAPEAYIQLHADRLDERGIDQRIPNLAWIAMVDALDDHGLLAEVDWREDPEDIVAQLRALRSSPTEPETWAWVDQVRFDLSTDDFLKVAGDRLRGAGTALVHLDIHSDCYPLVLLPVTRAAELVSLAAAAGYTVAVWGGPST